MGRQAEEALELTYDEMFTYLRANHSVYMEVDGATYYITDVNDHYWRAQDVTKFNEKGHYVDCSELVYLLDEFLSLPFMPEGKSINDVFDQATFYASIKD